MSHFRGPSRQEREQSMKFEITYGEYLLCNKSNRLFHYYDKDHTYKMTYSLEELPREILNKVPEYLKNFNFSDEHARNSHYDLGPAIYLPRNKSNDNSMTQNRIKENYPAIYQEIYNLGRNAENKRIMEWVNQYELGHIDKWQLRDGVLSGLSLSNTIDNEFQSFKNELSKTLE